MNQLEKKKQEIAKKMIGFQRGSEYRKYGELILQANKIQFLLIAAIILNSRCLSKKYCDELSTKTLGSLIIISQSCIPWATDALAKLNKYNLNRNRLAHKMYTPKKLTLSDCDKTLTGGKNIIVLLTKMTS